MQINIYLNSHFVGGLWKNKPFFFAAFGFYWRFLYILNVFLSNFLWREWEYKYEMLKIYKNKRKRKFAKECIRKICSISWEYVDEQFLINISNERQEKKCLFSATFELRHFWARKGCVVVVYACVFDFSTNYVIHMQKWQIRHRPGYSAQVCVHDTLM